MVAFRAADLQDRGKGLPGRPGAVVAAPAGAGVAAGTLVTFCHPVVSVPAVVCRGGTVRAGGWLPDFVRLGELERHIGDEVIEAIAARAVASGRVPAPQRRRLMSLPLVMRLTVAMTLMPGSGYAQVARQLAGHLADVPSARDWHVPTSKVFTGWRDMACPSPMEDLFWQVAGPLVADDAPSAVNPGGDAGVRDRRDAGRGGRYPGEPGGVRVRGHQHAERQRPSAVPAGPGGDR